MKTSRYGRKEGGVDRKGKRRNNVRIQPWNEERKQREAGRGRGMNHGIRNERRRK